MRPAELHGIRALPLFEGMTDAHFKRLTTAAFLQRFPPSVVIISEGGLPDFLHVVVEGMVELYATYSGRETTIDVLSPVTTFILAAVIRDQEYLKAARTLGPAQILMIPAAVVRDVFGRDAAFARAIVNELAIRYRSIVRALKNEKLRTGVERLACWILREDQRNGGQGRFALAYDKRTLASRLGMTPENLSRNFANLSKYGVRSAGREITITNRAALAGAAALDSLSDD